MEATFPLAHPSETLVSRSRRKRDRLMQAMPPVEAIDVSACRWAFWYAYSNRYRASPSSSEQRGGNRPCSAFDRVTCPRSPSPHFVQFGFRSWHARNHKSSGPVPSGPNGRRQNSSGSRCSNMRVRRDPVACCQTRVLTGLRAPYHSAHGVHSQPRHDAQNPNSRDQDGCL